MSSNDTAISVRDISKHYLIFARPEDRLKQSVMPRLQRWARRPPKQYYRDFAALKGVSFDVMRGETIGIIGRNGCGKSTLLQIICGILQPTSGDIRVNGRIAALLELGSGFNREFTGRENVYMNGAIIGLSRAEIAKRFDDIARFADIGQFIDQPVKIYSSGMQVRLAFATAINADPDILVVDEALAVGDDAFRRKCYARIEDIQKGGATILFVSHGTQTIVQLCTRAILLDRGELLLQGVPKTVVSQYHRLSNASPESAARVRSEIQVMSGAEVGAAAVPASSPLAPSGSTLSEEEAPEKVNRGPVRISTAASPGTEPDDFLAPALKPQSTVHLEERGARIRDARILALDGRQVNMLKLGRRYILEYLIDFTRSASDVGYGMAVRRLDGLNLAGASTRSLASRRIERVEPGQVAQVRIEFTCLMLPQTYFVTCGVNGIVDGERITLHRIIDALMLRVLPEKDILSNGSFDLSPSVTLSIASPHRERAIASSSVA